VGFTVVIPARYASTRLPGKILKDIEGKSLLHRVFLCAKKSAADSIIIATDDQRILDEASNIGAAACLTDQAHESGTQRISEVITKLNIPADTVIVNVQGDEPFMPAACIEQVANLLIENKQLEMATLCTPLLDTHEITDTNVVKVVVNKNEEAMYFSRAAIPWYRDEYERKSYSKEQLKNTFRHIGIYAYRAGFIQKLVAYPASQLEQIEKLEQLRVLWNGHVIRTAQATEIPGPGIDCQDDLLTARKLINQANS